MQKHGIPTPHAIARFQKLVLAYYREHGRAFPWRETHDPYRILVSEIMLQQTQTARVLSSYDRFVEAFPDFASLAAAPLHEVLRAWQGLGYNRRAVALQRTAQIVESSLSGALPSSPETLETLPGIGRYTAAAIAAFAFDRPVVFIETNIRAVFLHFFFRKTDQVADGQLVPLVEATLDREQPRDWYYALFDYGAMLKRSAAGGARSLHNRRQSAFAGSNREMRGRILRLLLEHSPVTERELADSLQAEEPRMKESLTQLRTEGFIEIDGDSVRIRDTD